MKVLHLSHDDIATGAGRAAFRVHRILNESKLVQSSMLVGLKNSSDHDVATSNSVFRKSLQLASPYIDKSLLSAMKLTGAFNSLNAFQTVATDQITNLQPAILHLHWINHSYLRLQTLLHFSQPIFWTCHDLWSIQGIAHYQNPHQLGWVDEYQLLEKKRIYKQLGKRLTFIAPSRWMEKKLLSSEVTQYNTVSYLPNLIDTKMYQPLNMKISRKIWNISTEKKIVLLHSYPHSEIRKGGDRIRKVVNVLLKDLEAEVHFFGHTAQEDIIRDPRVKYHGKITDDAALATLYSAADIFVHLARQDNLPNTILEAHACGTPTVSINVGGISDLYPASSSTQLLAQNASQLSQKLQHLLAHPKQIAFHSQQVRKHISTNFSPSSVDRFTQLYKSTVTKSSD